MQDSQGLPAEADWQVGLPAALGNQCPAPSASNPVKERCKIPEERLEAGDGWGGESVHSFPPTPPLPLSLWEGWVFSWPSIDQVYRQGLEKLISAGRDPGGTLPGPSQAQLSFAKPGSAYFAAHDPFGFWLGNFGVASNWVLSMRVSSAYWLTEQVPTVW